ncbi:hypothetical protein V3O24_12665 [Methylobacter sp. Wu8]|uniref:hypothetical protein n=1 Tax=Methylobacter sp. Wu8 TaxID=3118457 RepID=UPI002F30A0FE
MSSSNKKGYQFQRDVMGLLEKLQQRHPDLVSFSSQPRIELQNGELVIPDFQLVIHYTAETRHYLIECQDRKKYSHAILHKIQHIRNKQPLKVIFFVYGECIPDELQRAMTEEGIVFLVISEFEQFLLQVAEQLQNQPKRPANYSAPRYGGINGNQLLCSFDNALSRVSQVKAELPAAQSIAVALYFVYSRTESNTGNLIKGIREFDRKRINPFASYYPGWFDYGSGGTVLLADEPDFFERAYWAELSSLKQQLKGGFKDKGHDMLLIDLSIDGKLLFSRCLHVSLSSLSRQGMPLWDALLNMSLYFNDMELKSSEHARSYNTGLVVSKSSVVDAFLQFLQSKQVDIETTCERIAGEDIDVLPGDFGEIEI